MNQEKLSEIILLHELWLAGDGKGERANLSYANLRDANLYDANLERANLSGANLEDANLERANLSYANLRDANLYDANLYDANLSGANLEDANLYGANLYCANLSGANLEDANLERANLFKTDIISFQFGKHFGFCHEGMVKIGCVSKSLFEWIRDCEEIGINNGYSPSQIKYYSSMLNLLAELELIKE